MLKLMIVSIGALMATGAVAQVAPAAPTQGAGAAPQAQTMSPAEAAVESGFAKYDVDGSGALSEAEFTQWISDLKTAQSQAEGQTPDSESVTQYAAAALTAADRDKDKSVTKSEMTSFLGG